MPHSVKFCPAFIYSLMGLTSEAKSGPYYETSPQSPLWVQNDSKLSSPLSSSIPSDNYQGPHCQCILPCVYLWSSSDLVFLSQCRDTWKKPLLLFNVCCILFSLNTKPTSLGTFLLSLILRNYAATSH